MVPRALVTVVAEAPKHCQLAGRHCPRPPGRWLRIEVLYYSMTSRVYLDWNATTPLRPEAKTAMAAAWEHSGNPSSVHAEGRAARRLIEDARTAVAAAVGAVARNVVFTSGGTEANVLALSP